jgi:glycosyltransferase involved in cell wall biosynthesis
VRSLIDRYGLSDQVRFHGWLDDGTRDALMDRCHLLAVPSYHEGYGLVFVEAMASGLPVIAPSSGGAREVITHMREGFLVDPGDHQAIARHLQELDRDRGLLERMSAAAQARFENLPTWKDEMERARAHLLSVTGG